MKRVRIIVRGYVQGVFFRYHTYRLARQLGLRGFVRNLPDGSVEVVAEGMDTKLQQLVEFCREGPEAARVDSIEVEESTLDEELSGFEIRY
ncbi:acylphosphatase [Candidatus Woesearchaeota archaeon]|nr:acylphosphatase [Candidatus Woesearchaeota archaeon]RLE42941.1 MAG: acylphosphatase [Candidatus Woesearchaeota archaeon]